MNLRILIVDDEPIAQEILQTYSQKVPGLDVVGTCSNALEAFGMLSTRPVDLLFLDINMPEISGVDFLRSLKNPPLTIFTTAYPEYALTGYELDIVDYMVKPVPFERFLKGLQKAQRMLQLRPGESGTPLQDRDSTMFVKSGGKLIKVDLSELRLVEGLKDYVRLRVGGGSGIVVHSTMKHIEDMLAGKGNFIRVSKSCIVNMKYVREVDGNGIRIDGQVVVIGITYRDEVLAKFDKLKLL